MNHVLLYVREVLLEVDAVCRQRDDTAAAGLRERMAEDLWQLAGRFLPVNNRPRQIANIDLGIGSDYGKLNAYL